MSDAAWMIAGLYGMVAAGVTVGLATAPSIKHIAPSRWERWVACAWLGSIWLYEITRLYIDRLLRDE